MNINPLPSIIALIRIASLETNVFDVVDNPSIRSGYLYGKSSIYLPSCGKKMEQNYILPFRKKKLAN